MDVDGKPIYDSTEAFAKKLGVSRQTLSFWLKGDRTPDMDMLIKISKALNKSIDYLVGLSDIDSLDADIQAVSRITGLSEKAINELKNDLFQGDMASFIDGFVSHPDFRKFAIAYAHTYALASSVNKYNKGGFMTERIEFADSDSFIMITDFTMHDVMQGHCDRMCRYFDNYVNEYFERMLEAFSRAELTDEWPEHNDSEVK